MPFNEESFNKYEQDLDSPNEHYYQNHSETTNGKKKSKKMKKSKHLNEQVDQLQSSSNISNVGGVGDGGASSTASSNRELLTKRETKNFSYLILFVSVLFQLGSFVGIVITFIFPLWAVFQIDIPNSYSKLNINNTKNDISMTLQSNVINTNQIKFSLGIWEVKINAANLQLTDLNTNVETTNTQSMLWLNSDSNISFQAFLVNFLAFIEVSSANIFTIQILEILHLIFTFLTFCSTSFTLCLCSKKRTLLCWYLVCYFLCLVSFLIGLAVIIIIAVWQASALPSLVGSQAFVMSKSFNWCFWTAVGINSSLFSASFLIFCYIIVGSIMSYNKHKKIYQQKNSLSKKDMSKNNKGISILKNGKLNNSDMANDYANGKLPRLHTNILQPSSAFLSSSNSLLASNSATTFNNLQSISNNREINPSYTFYTGFGQYHKQNIRLNPILDDNTLDNSYRIQKQNENLNNYPMVNQKSNPILNPDHAYSNVFDQVNNDFRYQSYH